MNNLSDGDFFVQDTDFPKLYYYIEVGQYNPSNQVFWTEAINDDGKQHTYDMTVGVAGSVNLDVQTYSSRMYSYACSVGYSYPMIQVYQNGKQVGST